MKDYKCERVLWADLGKILEKWVKKGWVIYYLQRCRSGSYEIIFEKASQ